MSIKEFKNIEHLRPEMKFNSESYFNIGGSYLMMKREHYQKFEQAFTEINWIDDPDGIYNQVPEGLRIPDSEIPDGLTKVQTMKLINDYFKANVPDSFKEVVNDLLMSDQLAQLHAMFDIKVKFIDLWQGSEGCVWHWDGTDSADALILAYFSDHRTWKPEFGGQLEIGRRNGSGIGDMGLFTSNIDQEDVESYGFIPPSQRSLVVVNNQNPYLLHRCNLLAEKDIRRVTLTMGLDFVCKEDLSLPSKVIW